MAFKATVTLTNYIIIIRYDWLFLVAEVEQITVQNKCKTNWAQE